MGKLLIDQIDQLHDGLTSVTSGLVMDAGSPCRLAWEYLLKWMGASEEAIRANNVMLQDGFMEEVAKRSNKSYFGEWRYGGPEINRAIERAIKKALGKGNEALNFRLADMVVKILIALNRETPFSRLQDGFLICDVGAGDGSTTLAILNRMDTIEEARKLAPYCKFYLLEPSVKRLLKAQEDIGTHKLGGDPNNFEFVGSHLYMNMPKLAHGRFDMVVANAVFHHFTFPDYLKLISKNLHQDGIVVMGDWFTSVWSHPSYTMPILEKMGANDYRLEKFRSLFGFPLPDYKELDAALPSYQDRNANELMLKYVFALVDEMRGISSRGRLRFLEAHETLRQRMEKLYMAGFDTEMFSLRNHDAYSLTADEDRDVRISSNIVQVFPNNTIAYIISAAKLSDEMREKWKSRKRLPEKRRRAMAKRVCSG